MIEAMVADMLEIRKDGVWRSISSRVNEYATRLGSMDEIIGPIALMNCVGSDVGSDQDRVVLKPVFRQRHIDLLGIAAVQQQLRVCRERRR